MTFPKLSKNKILMIGLVVVAVAGYYLFMSGDDVVPLTTSESGAAETISQQLVIELNRLKSLQSIDDAIFRDPAFASLEDHTQSVVAQPLGRSNPFAPIGSN